MNLEQLKYFEEVCKCGSITKAADNLYISQQGLSMSMQRLEEHFSCKLFERDSRGMKPSEEGMFLLSRVQEILEKLQECEDHFMAKNAQKLPVHIGCINGAISEFAASLFYQFQNDHPEIQIIYKEYPELMLDQAVLDGEEELGFGLGPYDTDVFDSFLVFRQRHCLVIHKNNPLSKLDYISNSTLRGLPMVVCDETFKSTDTFIKNCRSLNAVPEIRIKTRDIFPVHRIVNALPELVGLSVMSVAEVMPMQNIVAIPLEDECFSWNIYMIAKKGSKFSKEARLFIDYTKENIQTR